VRSDSFHWQNVQGLPRASRGFVSSRSSKFDRVTTILAYFTALTPCLAFKDLLLTTPDLVERGEAKGGGREVMKQVKILK
jgi:hypothetical protein